MSNNDMPVAKYALRAHRAPGGTQQFECDARTVEEALEKWLAAIRNLNSQQRTLLEGDAGT